MFNTLTCDFTSVANATIQQTSKTFSIIPATAVTTNNKLPVHC